MALRLEEINSLTSLIYAAALEPAKWNQVLDRISAISGGVRTHIFGYDFEANLHLGAIYSGYDPDFIRTYDSYYYARNDWAEGFATFDPGIPLFSEQMCAREELQQGEFYNDWVKPQEDVIAGGGMLLFKEENRMFAFGGNIRRRDEEREGDWLQLVALLGPHMRQAFEISRRLAGQSIEKHALEQFGPGREPAVLMLNAEGLVAFANPKAQELAEAGYPFAIGENRRLILTHAQTRERVAEARARIKAGLALPPQSTLLTGTRRGPAYECRLGAIDPADIADLQIGLLAGSGGPCLLLTLTEANLRADAMLVFAHQFVLTEAELAVAGSFAKGYGLEEIAAHRQVSLNTIRNQLKSIMAKTGSHRQSDLMRLLLRTTGTEVRR